MECSNAGQRAAQERGQGADLYGARVKGEGNLNGDDPAVFVFFEQPRDFLAELLAGRQEACADIRSRGLRRRGWDAVPAVEAPPVVGAVAERAGFSGNDCCEDVDGAVEISNGSQMTASPNWSPVRRGVRPQAKSAG